MRRKQRASVYASQRRWRVIELVQEHPELGSRMDESLRHFVLRRFPFSVVYAVIEDLVYIVALAHGSREPNYCRLRVQDRKPIVGAGVLNARDSTTA